MCEIKYFPAGDSGLVLSFGDEISVHTNRRIRALAQKLTRETIVGIIECIPTYTTILVLYNPLAIGYDDLVSEIGSCYEDIEDDHISVSNIYHIPTVYGGRYGEDIDYVAEYNDISIEDVIKLHTERDYLIYMIGFTPGFPYLGGMSDKLITPRAKVPRERIAEGSVGIAGKQTGVYPIASPGGWQLIGRTPVRLFDAYREEPVLFKAGDYIRFERITEREYELISRDVMNNCYELGMTSVKGGALVG